MIVRGHERLLVQGITGRQGSFWTAHMQDYGTRVMGGVNPRKAGTRHCEVPVYESARAAMDDAGFEVSVLFIPPLGVRDAAVDAIEAGARKLVILTEHVPVQDVLYVLAAARANGAQVAGPNTAGHVTPGECFVGFMPAFDPDIFQPGEVGVITRSGSLGTLMCLNVVQAGFGQSALVGIGGDPVSGTSIRDALEVLDGDERTRAVVMVGEIGGAMGGRGGGVRRHHGKAGLRLRRGAGFSPGQEDGPCRCHRDGGSRNPRLQARRARRGGSGGARYPVRHRLGASHEARSGACVTGFIPRVQRSPTRLQVLDSPDERTMEIPYLRITRVGPQSLEYARSVHDVNEIVLGT